MNRKILSLVLICTITLPILPTTCATTDIPNTPIIPLINTKPLPSSTTQQTHTIPISLSPINNQNHIKSDNTVTTAQYQIIGAIMTNKKIYGRGIIRITANTINIGTAKAPVHEYIIQIDDIEICRGEIPELPPDPNVRYNIPALWVKCSNLTVVGPGRHTVKLIIKDTLGNNPDYIHTYNFLVIFIVWEKILDKETLLKKTPCGLPLKPVPTGKTNSPSFSGNDIPSPSKTPDSCETITPAPSEKFP